uniref:ADP,ATP carrier protein n=1 Tax=Loa loa TaxID=7209 RepID=A0A1I7V5J2_LOALO
MRHLERFKKYGQTEKELTCNLFAEFYGTVLLKNSIYWYWCDCSVAGHLALRYKLISAGNDRQDRTISLCCVGNLGWTCTSGSNGYFIHSWKGIFYSQSSVFRCAKFGAAFGARMMYMVYSETINTFDEGVRAINEQNATGIIFASYPQAYLSNTGAFIDQIPSLLFRRSITGANCGCSDWRVFLSVFYRSPYSETGGNKIDKDKWETDQENGLKQASRLLLLLLLL